MKIYQFFNELSDINSDLSKEIKSFISKFDVDEHYTFTTYTFEKTVIFINNENLIISFNVLSNDELEISISYACYDENLNSTGENKTISDVIRRNADKKKVINIIDKLLHQI